MSLERDGWTLHEPVHAFDWDGGTDRDRFVSILSMVSFKMLALVFVMVGVRDMGLAMNGACEFGC